ncbi:unnamed protein product [Aureobasidium uvarum]|uniref:F-box domain-containing protein n=1 Tax=Aureobasidium uvarum TaxID=2773716 RepID=A0A9N8KCY5_9PEZI|nr:unnamed protein product [Aureobasidium uvarum]
MSQLRTDQLSSTTDGRPPLPNSAMTSRSGLLECSNEVLNIIFGEPSLSKKDIKSLRLTSKELHPAATREFARRYFTNLVAVLSQNSLQSLVDICEHPLFRPYVLSVRFLTTSLSLERLRRDAQDIPFKSDPIDLATTLAMIGKHAELCKEQIQLETFGAKKLLVKAFSALEHPFAIKFTNAPESMDLVEVLGLPRITYDYDHATGKRCYDMFNNASKMKSLSGLVQEAIAELSAGDRKSFVSLKYHIRVLTGRVAYGNGIGDCIGRIGIDSFSQV